MRAGHYSGRGIFLTAIGAGPYLGHEISLFRFPGTRLDGCWAGETEAGYPPCKAASFSRGEPSATA